MNIPLNITETIQGWLINIMPEGAANIAAMISVALIYLIIFAVAGLYLVCSWINRYPFITDNNGY